MTLVGTFLHEFEQETSTTRRLLVVVPESKTAFRPHPKSWTLGELSLHLANIPTWMNRTLMTTELDLAPPGGPSWTRPRFESAAATLSAFDDHAKNARLALSKFIDEDLSVLWSLKKGGATLFSLPRAACLRSFVFNHMIHHRGQLTVYLRLCDVPLPQIYGPTADMPL